MKKIYPILFFTFFQILLIQSQSRFPLTYNSAWKVDSIDSQWNVAENTKYFIQGDTVINNVKYFKLYKTGVMILDVPFYYSNVYVGAIRDNDNKIYFVNKKSTKVRTLFDFNLKAGDTIVSEIANGKTVLSIDTLPDGRRIFNYDLSYENAGYIIEGIGTNGGLFSVGTTLFFLHSGESATYLICYSENGVLKFLSSETQSNCDIVNPHGQYKISESSEWKFSKSDNGNSQHYEKYQYAISGDTVISGVNYFKLKKKYNRLSKNSLGVYSLKVNETEYAGSIRDEDNKFYFVPKGSTNAILLYDFNLKIGDKVPGKIYNGGIITAIDTKLDNRKIFYVGSDFGKKIIAGIGSFKDFLNEKDEQANLSCYLENNVAVYHYRGIYDCDLSYEDASFTPCNRINILPDLIIGDDKKISIFLCYQVPSSNGFTPNLKSFFVKKDKNTYRISLLYEDPNILIPGDTMVVHIVNDTIPFGTLEKGEYTAEVSVSTVHTATGNDTTFNFIRFDNKFLSYYPQYTSTKNIFKNNLSVYPNPTKGLINIKTGNNSIRNIEVYNILGIKVKEKNNIGTNSAEINLSSLKKGIYFLKISDYDSNTLHKVILE